MIALDKFTPGHQVEFCRMLREDVDRAAIVLAEHRDQLQNRPLHALEWADSVYAAAVMVNQGDKMIGAILAYPEREWINVFRRLLDDVLMYARHNSRSTSAASNLMKAAHAEVNARILELFENSSYAADPEPTPEPAPAGDSVTLPLDVAIGLAMSLGGAVRMLQRLGNCEPVPTDQIKATATETYAAAERLQESASDFFTLAPDVKPTPESAPAAGRPFVDDCIDMLDAYNRAVDTSGEEFDRIDMAKDLLCKVAAHFQGTLAYERKTRLDAHTAAQISGALGGAVVMLQHFARRDDVDAVEIHRVIDTARGAAERLREVHFG